MKNSRSLALKARSQELDQKMKDIHWTMSHAVVAIAKVGRSRGDATVAIKSFPYPPSNNASYEVEVGWNSEGVAMVNVMSSHRHNLDPTKTWPTEAIDLVHDNLDLIWDTCEEYCRSVIRIEEFKKVMSRWEKK